MSQPFKPSMRTGRGGETLLCTMRVRQNLDGPLFNLIQSLEPGQMSGWVRDALKEAMAHGILTAKGLHVAADSANEALAAQLAQSRATCQQLRTQLEELVAERDALKAQVLAKQDEGQGGRPSADADIQAVSVLDDSEPMPIKPAGVKPSVFANAVRQGFGSHG